MSVIVDERTARQLSQGEKQLWLARARSAAMHVRDLDADDPRATPEPVPQERLQLASAGIANLSALLGELVELWNGPQDDEFGILRPTKHAFDEASRLLVDAAIIAAPRQRQIPQGCISTAADGGVRVEWVRQDASVHLIVPATSATAGYVYHEVGGDCDTEDVTPERLERWLREIR